MDDRSHEDPAGARRADEEPPPGDDGPPPGEERPRARDDRPPPGDETRHPRDDQPPPGDETRHPRDDQPAAGDGLPPPRDDQPAAGDGLPPPRDDQPVAGDDGPADGDGPVPAPELVDHTRADALLDELIAAEMGDEIAAAMRRGRRAQETRYRREHPDEGLRERKRRHTRQTISDVATTLFATRGFDAVTVSEVAERVGVSEKTVYNYFPTKESMVLDQADEAVDAMARALRDRGSNESLTDAVLRAVEDDMERFDEVSDELVEFMPMFVAMLETTPQLRAAWLELYDRVAEVTREELAAQAGLDPRDPEVAIAARALAGLAQVSLESRVRWIVEGLRGDELREAVGSDIERAARLLETGLWSFELLTRGARAARQAREVARAAEQARDQVVSALRQARETWAQVRRERQASSSSASEAEGRGSEATRQRQLRAAQAQQRRLEAAAAWARRALEAHERHHAAQRWREDDDRSDDER